ncbi:alpha/beta hydrolase [Microbispora cellulosiformans]|uniref:Alpha/beta hydrolase n=1 Tax=Microbispora cellulosiformans TaxID=2614688 RepID=A0A5J5K9I7_9ACTN|nr:alpha/beta hydrolase [Microbispora cellulosiformans]KAA9381651.1 alpha/beta hydrolase [Microbispora cellulosiformans]
MPRRLLRIPAAVGSLALVAATLTGTAGAATEARTGITAAATTPSHLSGTLADGATWIADVPADWNGTLLLFSHGYGPAVAQNAPSDEARTALLAEGYALAGSSFDPQGSWWALNSAERDQFATLDAFGRAVGRPSRTLSVGLSMGGLVNAQIARDGAGRVDGALGLCGLVAGGVDLDDYQYDAEYTIASLLLPGQEVRLTGFADAADAAATAQRLTDAVIAAQATPQGRARIALAAAYLNQSDWAPGQNPPAPGDHEGQEAQQFAWLSQGVLGFIENGRWSIEQSAGGNTSWNAGLDYAALLRDSEHAGQVRALYRKAGLDLRADLATLTRGADLRADPGARRRLEASSTAGQSLAVPLLDLHTIADQLVPVQQEAAFAERVRAAGDERLLRQAYVARQGHCAFTTAEIVAGVRAIDRRVTTGHWGDVAEPAVLQRSALSLNLGEAAFVRYQPGRLVVGRHSSRIGSHLPPGPAATM